FFLIIQHPPTPILFPYTTLFRSSLSLDFVNKEVTRIDQGITLTEILLKDPAYSLEVRLFFKSFHEENIIETWTSIKNTEDGVVQDRKSTRLNSSHVKISYAVFCL